MGLILFIKFILITIILVIETLILLFSLLVSVFYSIGYIKGLIAGNYTIRIPRSSEFHVMLFLKGRIKLYRCDEIKREICTKYETPFYSFCLSLMAIAILITLMPEYYSAALKFVIANVTYMILYFGGMYRKFGRKRATYIEVLNKNMQFLKLSFIPISFLIAIVGLFFAVSGWKIDETMVVNILELINEFTKTIGRGGSEDFFAFVTVLTTIIFVSYVVSLPLQALAYFIISVIIYAENYGRAYVDMIKKYITYVKKIICSI